MINSWFKWSLQILLVTSSYLLNLILTYHPLMSRIHLIIVWIFLWNCKYVSSNCFYFSSIRSLFSMTWNTGWSFHFQDFGGLLLPALFVTWISRNLNILKLNLDWGSTNNLRWLNLMNDTMKVIACFLYSSTMLTLTMAQKLKL